MSLAIPLFADLSKAARTVLYGDTSGEGAFMPAGGAKLSTNTITADGVVLNLAATSSPTGSTVTGGSGPGVINVLQPSFTAMFSPRSDVMLMGILGPAGAFTGAVTISQLLGVPGLQATVTATPPVINTSSSNSLTLDYTTPAARLRAVVTPGPGHLLVSQGVKAELSGTTSVGPCVLGARLAGDSATGKLSQGSLGANWTRITSHGNADNKNKNNGSGSGGTAGVGTLDGQQWGVVVSDSCPGRSVTLSFHQLLSGGATSLATEYTLPLSQAAVSPGGGSSSSSSLSEASSLLALGIAQRTSNGGLVKARVDQSGGVALLYQCQLEGDAGKLSLSCSCDPLAVNKVPPKFGFALSIS